MSSFDFGALPPEINSGRMYLGAGAGPLMAAASAWDGLAAELSSAASSYQATILELTGGQWLGAASVSMAAAAAPYVAWINTAAVQAERREVCGVTGRSALSQRTRSTSRSRRASARDACDPDPRTRLRPTGADRRPCG